jgi:HK97 family phage major capsid protein
MFTLNLSNLGSMDAGQLRHALADIDTELLSLHADDSGELRNLSGADSERFEFLTNIRPRVEAHINVRQSFNRAPGQTVFGGRDENSREETRDRPPYVRDAHDEALRAVERVVNQGRMAPDAADRVDNLIRHEDTRDGLGAQYLAAVGDPEYLGAFIHMLKDPMTGHLRMSQREHEAVRRVTQIQELRAMNVTTGSAGGFAVPIDLDASILSTGSGSLNPIREISDVRTTVGDVWKGVSADAPTAFYQAEASEMADSSPTLAQPSITTQRGTAFIPVSCEVLMDWPRDQLVNELTNLLNESKNNLDSSKWLTGTGTNEPGGILNIGGTGGLTTTQRVHTNTTAVTAIGDVYLLKQALGATKFMENATWAAHPNVLDVFYRFVASGSTTEPQIFDGGRGGPLLGRPVVEWSNMGTATTTTTTKIAILGDWSGFTIVDRLGSTVEIAPQLFGPTNRFPTGQRGIIYWWRSGSGVTKHNAFRYLEVK